MNWLRRERGRRRIPGAMELQIRKLLLGADAGSVANPETMTNPENMAFFKDLATQHAASMP